MNESTMNLIDEVALQATEEAEHALDKQLEELAGFGGAPIGSRGRKLDESQETAPYSADESDSSDNSRHSHRSGSSSDESGLGGDSADAADMD